MSNKENEEVATLTAFMPWLKPEEALELLRHYGGDAETVMRFLEEAAAAHDDPSSSQSSSQPKPVKGDKTATGAKRKVENHFVGGGPSSGQVVLGGDVDVDNVIETLFDKARQGTDGDDSDDPQSFFGRGRRLGHTTSASPFIESTLRQRREIVVAVYRNGYRVNDGPRMPKETPEGMAFFRALETGVVPDSIARMYPDTNISVRLVDCSKEDAPPTFSPFSGGGHRLVGNASTPAPAPPTSAAQSANVRGKFELHEGEEVAKLAIVNFSGQRREFRVNPGRHTVGDLFLLAAQEAQPGALAFQLVARDVPPRPLVDKSLTIDAAKLRNATVMMRPC